MLMSLFEWNLLHFTFLADLPIHHALNFTMDYFHALTAVCWNSSLKHEPANRHSV